MKLLLCISGHGAGHLAQVAPIAAALREAMPECALLVRSALPERALRTRLSFSFEVMPAPEDFGLAMRNPYAVDWPETIERYQKHASRFDAEAAALARYMHDRHVTGVVTNASYLPLESGRIAGIPSLAFSSVNWLDVLLAYGASDEPRLSQALEQIGAAYRRADAFVGLMPGLPMPHFATIPFAKPIVTVGTERRSALCRQLGVGETARVVVFSYDDSAAAPPVEPQAVKGLVLIGPQRWTDQSGWIGIGDTRLPFLDLIASADLVVGKPGYGIVTEAAAAGTPLLLLGRTDWPETASLIAWLAQFGRARHCNLPLEGLTAALLLQMLEDPPPPPREAVSLDGAQRLAGLIRAGVCGE